MQMDPTERAFAQFVRVAAALAAPSRLRLLDRLLQGEQTVDELAASTDISISNASRQLRLLAEAGLIVARREPPFVYYRVASDEVISFWFALRDLARSQLAEFDRIATDLLQHHDTLTPLAREELLERMQTGEVVMLDVRPGNEYRAGHIAGALSVPLAELEARLGSIPRTFQVVAYCRGPYCMLSYDAVNQLRERGFEAIRLEDGFPEWKAAGLPIGVGS